MPVTTVNPIYTAEEIARQMQNSGAKVVVTIPQMADTMRQVASLCPDIKKLIVIGQADGFIPITDMFKDAGDLFNDNIEVLIFIFRIFIKFGQFLKFLNFTFDWRRILTVTDQFFFEIYNNLDLIFVIFNFDS